jgi:hypothetical protein
MQVDQGLLHGLKYLWLYSQHLLKSNQRWCLYSRGGGSPDMGHEHATGLYPRRGLHLWHQDEVVSLFCLP